jgi:hypothetical protein
LVDTIIPRMKPGYSLAKTILIAQKV